MSQIEDSTSPPTTKPRGGCFLGCWRFSCQKVADKIPHGDASDVNTIRRKKARRISWVPVDASTVEKVNGNENTPFNSKTSPKRLVVPAIRDNQVPDHQTLVHDNSGQKFDDGCDRITDQEGESVVPQPRETLDKEESSKSKSKSKDRHGISLSRKSSSNQKREKAGNGEAMRKHLLPLASFQMLNLERKKTAPEADKDRVDYSKQRRKRNANANSSSRAKLEPVVGLSILMVTLIIMLVWGRLCAILCTSAWFYFIPLLRNLNNNKAACQGVEKGSSSAENVEVEQEQVLVLDYNKMKKRVVLEGFLDRNRRLSAGNSFLSSPLTTT
ncbi:hypothetical protein NMG60_11024212 [Bertholletia excelsa]